MIKFTCSKCGKSISVDDRHAGKKGKCPKCETAVVVPERSTVIEFRCDHCGRKIKVPDRYAGKKGKCPKCKAPIVVPAPQGESVTEGAAAAAAVACAMCGQTVVVARGLAEEAVECSGCGRMIDPSSGSVVSWPEETVPGELDEGPYKEPAAPETSGGLNRRLIALVGGAAVIVLVGAVAVVLYLRALGSGAAPPVRPRPRRDVAQTEPPIQPAPVAEPRPAEQTTSSEPADAIRLQFRPDPGTRRTMRVTTRSGATAKSEGQQLDVTYTQSFTVDLEALEARADGTIPVEVTLAAIQVKTEMPGMPASGYDSAQADSEGNSMAGIFVPFVGKRFTITVSARGEIVDPALDALFLAAATDRIAAEDAMREQLKDRTQAARERAHQHSGSRASRALQLKKDLEEFPIFGAGHIRHLLDHLFTAVPSGTVEKNTQWNAPVAVHVGTRLEIPGTHAVTAIDADTCTISGEGRRSLDEGPFIYQAGPVTVSKKLGGSSQVRLTVDRQTGWLRSKEQTTTLSGRVLTTTAGVPGQESFTDDSMQIRTTVTVVD